MKKILSVLLATAMLLSMVSVMAVGLSAAPADGYYVGVTEQIGLQFAETGKDKGPLTLDGASVSADAAYPATAFFNGWFAVGTVIRSYQLYIGTEEKSDAISYTFNKAPSISAGAEYANEESLATATFNIFITLPEGHHDEVTIYAVDKNGDKYLAFKFTNLTITAAEKTVSEEGIPVETTPCWKLEPNALANGTGVNRTTVTNNGYYTTFQASTAGDPYLNYVTSETKVGRFLLIKYNNHTQVNRMQIYMAQAAGIQSDSNMIEFAISNDYSGWTYVIVDLAQNPFYNKDTMAVCSLRFDPLEARNAMPDYTFTGTETIDVAYIMGFTTSAGLQGYLNANELHAVTKTATVKEDQLSADKTKYTDKNGIEHAVTLQEDGTYTYTYQTTDVRTPCDTTPKLMLDGSYLLGNTYNACEVTYDKETGVATLKATGADPNYWVINKAGTTAGRYMAIKYKTTVDSDMEFFLSSTDAGPAGGQSFRQAYTRDGEWHTMIIDLSTCGVSTLNTETYSLNFLRLDFFTGATEGEMQIEYIAFFDSEDAAFQYAHTYQTYTITFKADGRVVESIVFEHGTTSIQAPAVPVKEGYTGVWTAYTLSDSNITVTAKYTKIEVPTEAKTDAPTEKPTEAPTEKPTEAETGTATEAATASPATDPAPINGCGSVVAVSALSVLAVAALAGVSLKKKEN